MRHIQSIGLHCLLFYVFCCDFKEVKCQIFKERKEKNLQVPGSVAAVLNGVFWFHCRLVDPSSSGHSSEAAASLLEVHL